MGAAPICCGVALVEDQHHQTAEIEVLRPENIVREEGPLFKKAESLPASLPFDAIDLLIIDRIGKDISGSGMDTNVIERDIAGYASTLHSSSTVTPRVSRIFVRDLTPASNGNGIGIGMADFTTARFVKSLNVEYTYMNALASLGMQGAKIPIYFDVRISNRYRFGLIRLGFLCFLLGVDAPGSPSTSLRAGSRRCAPPDSCWIGRLWRTSFGFLYGKPHARSR